MPVIPARSHPGFIFLVSALVIGTIAVTALISLTLLGWAAQQNGFAEVQSHQAFENAHTCAERAIRSLRLDPSYGGDQTFGLSYGSCTVHPIGGAGNANRSVCVEGRDGGAVSRMEIVLAKIFPSVTVSSWQEVAAISICP